MLSPEEIHQDFKEYSQAELDIIHDNPWLIPASIALCTVPLAISIHGFWKNRILNKQLKIERERTKQMALRTSDNQDSFGLH